MSSPSAPSAPASGVNKFEYHILEERAPNHLEAQIEEWAAAGYRVISYAIHPDGKYSAIVEGPESEETRISRDRAKTEALENG